MTADAKERLDALHRGFRHRYLGWEELSAQLAAWAEAFPEVVRLSSIGRTGEGRELWLLAIGPDPDRARPAVWVDGNMHASELCGSSAALAIAEDVIRLHVAPDAPLHGLPAHLLDVIRGVLFYVLPRMSPDGAECVLTTGRSVRSVPRDERPNRSHARWHMRDVDGDGVAAVMRKADPGGEYVESSVAPGLLVQRRLEDAGPFYKLYPEGVIEHFDGFHVPTPGYLGDNSPDLNRNFPHGWAGETDQVGSGPHPTSEPESRAVVEFASRTPHLFAWLDFHTFGGCFIRPLGHLPDSKMDPSDLSLFRQIGAWAEELTGYPMVSGFEEFTYEPDKPLHGDITDFAYHQRGCIAYAVELWDFFHRMGRPRPKKFVDHYTHMTREDWERFAAWDAEHNRSRALRPWRRFEHPQIGEVEIGGVDPRVGISNPPYEDIADIVRAQSAAFMRVAALAPRLVFGRLDRRSLGEGLFELVASVENRGYLPTFVLGSAKKLAFDEPLHADLETAGCSLVDAGERHREIGHLDGWGRGLFDGSTSVFLMRSRGTTHARTLRWTLRGAGEVVLRVGSCRVGWIEAKIRIE